MVRVEATLKATPPNELEARARALILALIRTRGGANDFDVFDLLETVPIPAARALELLEELRRDGRIHVLDGEWRAIDA